MKKSVLYLLLSFLAAACTLAFNSCERQLPTLRIFTWASYFDPHVVQEFEKQYHCRVVFDIFESNELMYAKLKAGRESYDILTPSIYMANLMAKQQMVAALDWSKLPNLQTLDPIYCEIKDYAPYFAPYLISITGIGYLKSRVSIDNPSWSLLARPSLRWRTTMLNDYRETLGIGLLYLGYNPNKCTEDQMEQTLNILQKWKTNIAKFENEQYKLGLDSAEFLAVHGYNGDIAQIMDSNSDIGFFLPKEGFLYSVDVFCLHRNCREPELAHDFINFMHQPEIAARNTVHTCYLCPNTASYPLIPESMRNNPAIFIPASDMKRAHLIFDVGEENHMFLQAWDRLRSN